MKLSYLGYLFAALQGEREAEKRKVAKESKLEKLPVDAFIYNILLFLQVKDLFIVEQANRRIYSMINESNFWSIYAKKHFKSPKNEKNVKEYCRVFERGNSTNLYKTKSKVGFLAGPTKKTSDIIEESNLNRETKKDLHQYFGTSSYYFLCGGFL
jgi:hypothetical protein